MTKFSASAFMLLIFTAALLSTTEGAPKPLHQRCDCIQPRSEQAIPIHRIQSLRVIPAGSHCKKEQIIATMKKRNMCLDPTKDWVISLKPKFDKNGVKIQQ